MCGEGIDKSGHYLVTASWFVKDALQVINCDHDLTKRLENLVSPKIKASIYHVQKRLDICKTHSFCERLRL